MLGFNVETRVHQLFPDAQQAGSGWIARCPAHDDRKPSLSIGVGEDDRLLLHCHAGCTVGAICSAAGIGVKDLFLPQQDPPKMTATAPKAAVTLYPDLKAAVQAVEETTRARARTLWDYRYADGREAMWVIRLERDEEKTYRPIQPLNGQYALGAPPGPLPLYRLPELPAEGPIYVAEGEKAADAGWEIGLSTTTSAHGSSAPSRTDWSPLAGREVIILPDRDEPGEKYADAVKKILEEGTKPPANVTICRLPEPETEGSDLADLLYQRRDQEGRYVEEIREEIEGLAQRAREENLFFCTVSSFNGFPVVRVPDYQVEEWLFQESFTICGGDPKSLKTGLALTLSLGALTGQPLFGKFPVYRQGSVALLEADMGEGYFAYTFQQYALGQGLELKSPLQHSIAYRCTAEVDIRDRGTQERILAELHALEPALVVLDPLRDLHGGNENAAEELKPVMDYCLRLRDELHAVVFLIDHLVKPERGGRGSQNPLSYALRGSGSKYGRADSVLIARDVGLGVTELQATHRYGPPPGPICYHFVDRNEEGGGFRLELCDPPTGGQQTSPEERVLEWLKANPGYWSLRDIRSGARVRHDDAKPAIINLKGRGLVGSDGSKPYPKWALKEEEGSV